MTPEYAKKLLDRATPGPWQSRADGPSSGKPHLYVCTCEDRTEVAEAVGWDDAPLISEAPKLAGLVAGMRTEYAVQYLFHGEWQDTRYRRDTKQEAERVRRLYPQYDTRVVRRLTTEWEVVE